MEAGASAEVCRPEGGSRHHRQGRLREQSARRPLPAAPPVSAPGMNAAPT